MVQPDYIIRLSPNTGGPMPGSTRTVIVHSTRSGKSMNPTEFEGTLNYMQDPAPGGDPRRAVSSHWVIARDGRKARVVPDNQQAWHAGEDNDNAWGIELEQGVESDGFTEPQLLSLIMVCRDYVAMGVPARHSANSTEGGFIGHQETEQGKRSGKSDPGSLFPWQEFILALQDEPESHWLYGDMVAGEQVVGNQVFVWHRGIVINKIGDVEGNFPGQRWHNEGGVFVLKEP